MEKKITLETVSEDIEKLSRSTADSIATLSGNIEKLSRSTSNSIEKLARMTQAGFLDMQTKMATKEDVARLEGRVEKLEKRVVEWGQRTVELESRMDVLDRSMGNLREQMQNGFRDMVMESRELRRLLGAVDQRKEVAGLKVRVETIEEKLGIEP